GQVEHDVAAPRLKTARARLAAKQKLQRAQIKSQTPIALFLGAKLIAYTLLGALLGWLGSVMELDLPARAFLQFAIGIFLVGNALRMFNVHPIFRYFTFEPPSFITRYIRRTAKNSSGWITPAFLGFLTVLIPCGVTQAVMALAMGSGDATRGALIMFSFTLGTSPVFGVLAYLATSLGSRLEKWFNVIAAIVIAITGVYALQSGFTLSGYPITVLPTIGSAPITTAQVDAPAQAAYQEIVIRADDNGYSPNLIRARGNMPIKLRLVTNDTYSCARAFAIPNLRMRTVLPQTGEKILDVPAQPIGSTLRVTCTMSMYTGQIVFY
ncbi:MAG: sulfite exporter TauE/SafE family protein, partial [Chloroflexi bacterium]|nr:sulfite exporter TauE/SafE family protein [Chloroflexota bacterium]